MKIGLFTGSIAFALGALAIFACSPPAQAHNADYCRGADHISLLLVDGTTPYDDDDRVVFARGMNGVFSALGVGERLVIRTISAEYAGSSVIFDECAPGCRPQDVGLTGSCNPLVARRDQRQFQIRYQNAARAVLAASSNQPRSEIAMTIAVTTAQYRTHGLRRVYIFSDLLENSPSAPWPLIERDAPQAFVDRFRAVGGVSDLRGVSVAVFGFGRDHTPERHSLAPAARQHLQQVWSAYFAAAGTRASIEQDLQ